MKNNTILLYFFSIAFFCVFPVFGQRSYIKGPSLVSYKSTSTYLLMGASGPSDAQWGVQGGTIQNSDKTSATIRWDGDITSGRVSFNSSSTGTLTLAVSITDVPPRIPANPKITNTDCTKATLSRNGTPPSGVTWYWQGKNSNGTSTNLGSGSTYTAAQGSGVYYIKARNSDGIWSEGSGAVHITIPNDLLDVPPLPSIKNNCGNTVLSHGNPPSGITWYWQSSAGGTSTSTSNLSASITLTSGTVYYLRARHDSSGCWSAARTINYTVTQQKTWYADPDGDGFGDASDTKVFCSQPAGYVERAGDNCPDVYGDANGCPDEDYKAITLSNENYIYTRTYQKEMTASGGIEKNADVLESVVYYDGLGRPKQEVSVRQSPGMHDVVRHIGYNAVGRQDKEYLPFVPDPAQGGYGTFRTGDMAGGTAAYYLDRYGSDFTGMNASQANAYSQKQFEASPLNRVEKQAAPGKDWKLGNGHEIEFGYSTNTATEVRLFQVSFLNGNPEAPQLEAVANKHYGAGQLYKTITRDENHSGTTKDHTTEEFKDKQGRVVLKRTYNNGSQHNTFYVYDDYGNLTYVIPPKVNISEGISTAELNELCYQYKYDGRNRLIEKKLPGKWWESIVYNTLDQPVMTQDSLLKAQKKWLFTKYDAFGRVIYTGQTSHSQSRGELQAIFNRAAKKYETRIQSPASPTAIQGMNVYYTNVSPPTGIYQVFTINYYDDYMFDLAGLTVPTAVLGQAVNMRTKTLATGSKTRVLGTNHWITTIHAYNSRGMLIYTATKNPYLNTTDIVENRLDFVGKVLESKTTHTKGSNAAIVTVDKLTYDHAGRLLTHTQKIGNQAEELIAENVYDDLGQLKVKKVGNTPSKPLQEVNYAYNVRGWLTGINDVDNPGGKLFNFQVNYNRSRSGTVLPLFNGNIAETYWKTANDNTMRRYAYTYDALNRITSGKFNGSGQTDRYTVKDIGYDKNGNITKLTRNGHLVANPVQSNAGHFGEMDKLTYAYHNGGNFLVKVTEAHTANKTYGFKDGSNTDNDYARDVNGNMTRDKNKGITGITYNHLNLPTQVSFGSNKIVYIYDALGTKLKKEVTQGSSVTGTEYAGKYIYENSQLKQVSHPEGYFEPKAGGGYQYVYRYTDIWGNTRITYADDNGDGVASTSEIRREQNYYPGGLEHRGYNGAMSGVKNNLKTYQGQEFTEDLGLNTHEWKFRVSDPATLRFWQIDPLAEDYYYNSTYAFQENKLGLGIELEGLELSRTRGGTNQVSNSINRAYKEVTNVQREMNLQGANGDQATEIARRERVSEYSNAAGGITEGVEDISKGVVYSTGDVVDEVGDHIETGALIAAPFTEGASLTALPLAESMQVTGKGMKIAVHMSDENYTGALKEGASILGNKVISKATKKIISHSKKVGNIETKKQEQTQETALGVVGKFFQEVFKRTVEIFSEDDNVIK
ncbi:hypothetical protein ED312_08570 [Sinomicrobium pectinilyticum]|uniref:DUF6443 domain-containing protein n=1 Tax=Sinomicrobium pectinilyticum TaxID=1084421 RepID=A0A3N0EL41_SINP1|nr:DUF6443 domain-containing protein [Sinomicrobium pectinilyticum]RNL88492.1 hypothetical protein ED312_08570 [Sinomicrobium pectinilyticum]